MDLIQVDDLLVASLVKATREGLSMANVKPVPVGLSKYVNCTREVSTVVGLAGQMSGSFLMNTSTPLALYLAENMLAEKMESLTGEVLDSLAEIGNIIAGKTKAILSTTAYKFEKISIPSVVVGNNYFISLYRGMQTVSVDFELSSMPMTPTNDRFFSVSLSLMKVN